MKKSIYAIILALLPWCLGAQMDSLVYQLPDIVIKGNRLSIPFSEASRTIDIITAEQIKLMPVRSVNEVLQYVSGIDVRQRGPHGVQADISIRGGTFDQTLVLINGVKLVDPQTGHHIMNLPIDIENIERVEVLKGPSARIYGQNGFTGAINIVTKNPEEDFVKIRLQGGSYDLGGVRASASFLKDKSKHYLSFSKDFSEGYRFNTDYDITNLFYQSEFEVGKEKLNLLAGFTERQFGANGFYASPDFTDQYEEVQTSLVSLNYNFSANNWTFNPRLYWRRNQDEYIFVRNNPSIFRNMHIGNVYGLELHSTNENKLGTTGIGLEFSQVDLNSTNLGDRDRFTSSLFVEHRFQLMDGKLDVTPGILVNNFSDFGTRLFPGLDVGYRLTGPLKLYGNVGYTYRVPTFTDLYYEDRANLGNPDLEPEEAIAFEAGFKYTYRGVNFQASYFNRNGSDLIDWTKEADTLQWQPININDLNSQGVDISLNMFFPVITGTNGFLQRFNIGYTYIDAMIEDNEAAISRYALENLRHQLIAGLEFKLGNRLFYSTRYRYIDRVTMDDYNILDMQLLYRAKDFEVFLNASNIGDTEYRETNLVMMPGRWITGGVEIKFR